MIQYSPWIVRRAIDNDYSELWRGLRLSLGYALLFVVVVILVINISFLFNDTLTPFASYSFRSTEFQLIQNYFRPIARLPIPVPYPYLEGMDWALFNNRTGSNFGNVYLPGEIRQGGTISSPWDISTTPTSSMTSILPVSHLD